MFIGEAPKILYWLSVQVFSKDEACKSIGYCNPFTTKLLLQTKQFFISPQSLKVEHFRKRAMLEDTVCAEITFRKLQKMLCRGSV